MRLPHEALVLVHRPGRQVLVLRRCPEHGGYWHAVSGALLVERLETGEARRR